MDKESVLSHAHACALSLYIYILYKIYIYDGILAIKRNILESVLMRWMKLESIIQSEVSQKEKDKYHILMHINGI